MHDNITLIAPHKDIVRLLRLPTVQLYFDIQVPSENNWNVAVAVSMEMIRFFFFFLVGGREGYFYFSQGQLFKISAHQHFFCLPRHLSSISPTPICRSWCWICFSCMAFCQTRKYRNNSENKHQKYLSLWTFLFLLESLISYFPFFPPFSLLIFSVLIDMFIILQWDFFSLPFSSSVENISAAVFYFSAADQAIIFLSITNAFLIY